MSRNALSNTEQCELERFNPPSYHIRGSPDRYCQRFIDCSFKEMFEDLVPVPIFEGLLLPQWTTGNWLTTVDLVELEAPNNIKSLLAKIQEVYRIHLLGHQNVISFMVTFLRILKFDDYPCCLYWELPEHQMYLHTGPDYTVIKINGCRNKRLVILDGSGLVNADYSNQWEEDKVLWVIDHIMWRICNSNFEPNKDISIPIHIFAIRVVGTQFTFYKATAYELCRDFDWLTIQRHPPVIDSVHLTAYDICDIRDREAILRGMASIRKFLTET